METGSLGDTVEQGGFGRSHPHLAAIREASEEGGPPAWIEVSRDLVEKQDRRLSALFGNDVCMRENKAEQQCFLLSC